MKNFRYYSIFLDIKQIKTARLKERGFNLDFRYFIGTYKKKPQTIIRLGL